MTCSGNYSTGTQVGCGSTFQEAQAAVTQSLTDTANSYCSPSSACNLTFFYKWGASGCPAGQVGVFGGADFGCTGGGGGGGGGGGCGPGGCSG